MLKEKISAMIIALVMLVTVMPLTAASAHALGGAGTKTNPYKISTYDELKEFAKIVNGTHGSIAQNAGACAILTADINCTDKKWVPICTNKTPYTGTFDGNGMTIKKLSNKDFVKDDFEGLFKGVDTDGSIQSIGFEDVSIHGKSRVGVVAGTNQGSISNCHISGNVIGDESKIGGVVGINGGIIKNCYNTGDISGNSEVGGVAGSNDVGGTITNCYNTGNVNGSAGDIGGVAGLGPSGTIQNCCNIGNVNGNGSDIGGVVGCTGAGMVINCYNTGDVNGNNNVGGIEGYCNRGGTAITNCYNTGDISGNNTVGGLVGAHVQGLKQVTNCYSTGNVSGNVNVGGLSGLTSKGMMTYCYYDTTQSGCEAGDGMYGNFDTIKGLTTEQMIGEKALYNMVFEYGTVESSPWMVKESDQTANYYPHLKGFNFDEYGEQMVPGDISAYKWPPRIDLIVAPPVFSPASCEFGPHQSIRISSATRKATIYYTTDGTEPTQASNKYTEPIVITDKTTIKAFAVKEKAKDSGIATATYTHIHEYGAWKKVDDKQHQRVCEHDDTHVEKENHKWDAGKMTKAATEKAEGVKTYTCTVCKTTKTETITKLKIAVSGTLTAKMTAGKTRITIGWNKIQGAAGYDIFFAQCNHSGKKIVCKSVKTIKGNKTFTWKNSGLKKGTAYKAYVKAYVLKNGKKTYVRKSPLMHAYTGNGTKTYTNAKSVTIKNVKKGKLSLKKGKTFKIRAKVNKINRKKKLMPKVHAPTLRYMTSNKKVATVSMSGKITAKSKGACSIYVYAHNGVSKKVKVKVK